MKKHTFWCRWIQCVGLFMAAFCVLVGVAAQSRLFRSVFETTAFLGNKIDPAVVDGAGGFKTYLYGMVGGGGFGFGILLFFLARFALAERKAWAWVAILISVAGWFIVDTAASVSAGVLMNALVNAVFLILIAVPLAATASVLKTPGQRM